MPVIERYDGLTAYQRAELRKLTDKGWSIVRIRRLQDGLNPWASVDMRAPGGDLMLTAVAVSKREEDHITNAR